MAIPVQTIQGLIQVCGNSDEAAAYLAEKVEKLANKAGLDNMQGTVDALKKLARDLYNEGDKATTAALTGKFISWQEIRERDEVNLDALKTLNAEELAKNSVQLVIQTDADCTWERNYEPDSLNPEVCQMMDQLLLAWIAATGLSRQEHKMFEIPDGQDDVDITKAKPLDAHELERYFNNPGRGKQSFADYVKQETNGKIQLNGVHFSAVQLQPDQQQQSGSSNQ